MRMQDSRALGHSLLLSQSKSRELDGKWTIWDMKWHTYGMSVLESGGLTNWAITLTHHILNFSLKINRHLSAN